MILKNFPDTLNDAYFFLFAEPVAIKNLRSSLFYLKLTNNLVNRYYNFHFIGRETETVDTL